MGRRSKTILGWAVLAAVALLATAAGAATLNKRARLREGPSKETKLLGWVEDGTPVTIEGERGGWYAVRTPDGQTGYIWQEHLRFDGGEAAPPPTSPTTSMPTATTSPPPPPAPAPTAPPAPEARPIPAPAERSDPNLAAELERIRTELARLAAAQQELAQRTASRSGRPDGPPAPLGSDGSAGAAVVFFGVGAVVGWLFGRFAASRRERRSRLRI